MNLSALKPKSTLELSALAEKLGVPGAEALRRHALMVAILTAENGDGEPLAGEGVLEVLGDGFGFLRTPETHYLPGTDDIYVSPSQIRRFGLHTGDAVSGVVRPPKEAERYFALLRVQTINDGAPDDHRNKLSFRDIPAVHPAKRLPIADAKEAQLAAIDATCPLGRGQRTLLVGPPRSGKSALLWKLGQAIANDKDCTVVGVFVDARPEETADAQELANCAALLCSCNDEAPARHVQLAEIAVARAKRIALAGGHCVLLLDSLNRLTRAYAATNDASAISAASRVKRLFAAARSLETGGSVTILATVCSRDAYDHELPCLEDWLATANCEIWLEVDGTLDANRSHTRQPDLLV